MVQKPIFPLVVSGVKLILSTRVLKKFLLLKKVTKKRN